MKIIGFGHRRRTGKNVAAKFYAAHYQIKNPGTYIISRGFADKLYDIAYQLYKWAGFQSKEYYEQNPTEKEEPLILLGKSPRQLLIDVGQAFRSVYSATWIDYLLESLEQKKVNLLLITDVRFPNEIERIKSKGGFVIRIDRDDVPKFDDEADTAALHYDDWDSIIQNNGTLKEFHNEVIEVCDDLLLGTNNDDNGD